MDLNTGSLFIIATPIGNLTDVTFRALEVLAEVDLILCEDTRVSKNLLDHYKIKRPLLFKRPLLSYHHHSDSRKINEIAARLAEGKNLALITDAGTPGISDPGNVLIAALLKRYPEITVVPIPGPSAVIAALSISGFPADKFIFLGFPPHKNKRGQFFKQVSESNCTTVFYESGHRIKKCLQELSAVMAAQRPVVVCRELTKKFETVYRGTIKEVATAMTDERGEFVVIIKAPN